MDQGLKERLIGAAVLVALGVWIIPWVLDGSAPPRDERPAALELPAPTESAQLRSQTIRLDQSDRDTLGAPSAHERERSEPEPTATQRTARIVPGEQRTSDSSALPPAAEGTPEPHAQRDRSAAAPSRPAEPAEAAGATRGPAAAAPSLEPAVAADERNDSETREAASKHAAAWMVQLGSFSEEENARRLMQRVATFGYEPEMSNHRAGGGLMYRVRIGPHASRPQAEAAASSLAAHGFVVQVVTTD
jgi:DedD protein